MSGFWMWAKDALLMTAFLMVLSLLVPPLRTIVFALFGKVFTPIGGAMLESLFRWAVYVMKIYWRYAWIIIRSLTTPKKRLFKSLEDEKSN